MFSERLEDFGAKFITFFESIRCNLNHELQTMKLLLLIALLVIVPAESRLAGECAGMCNDLRLEVLTNEMCRYVYIIRLLFSFL